MGFLFVVIPIFYYLLASLINIYNARRNKPDEETNLTSVININIYMDRETPYNDIKI